jgi:hypothetical protein
MKTQDIEKMLIEDMREKRKIGSGSFHKRGKGVKHGMSGALRTPSYYMSNKEKKKLNGEVTVSNMYETLIPFKEFDLKDRETQKSILTKWRELHDNLTIRKGLGISNKAFYDLVAELEIPRKRRIEPGRTKRNKPKQAKVQIAPKKSLMETMQFLGEEREVLEVKEEVAKEVVKEEPPVKSLLVTNGLHLEYNGSYQVEALSTLFTKLQLLLEGEPNKYRISLSLSEIVE